MTRSRSFRRALAALAVAGVLTTVAAAPSFATAPDQSVAIPVYPSDVDATNYSASFLASPAPRTIDRLVAADFHTSIAPAPTAAWVVDIEDKPYNGFDATTEGWLLHADPTAGLSPSSTPPTAKTRLMHYVASATYEIDESTPTVEDLTDELVVTMSYPDMVGSSTSRGGFSFEFIAQTELAPGQWHIVSGFFNIPPAATALATYSFGTYGQVGVNSRVTESGGTWSIDASQFQYGSPGNGGLGAFLSAFGDYDVVAFGPNVGRYANPDAEVLLQSVRVLGQTFSFVEEEAAPAPAPAADSQGLETLLAGEGVTPTDLGTPATPSNFSFTSAWTSFDGWVDVYGYSTPVYLGTFPVVNGAVDLTGLDLSSLSPGTHTLLLVGQSSTSVLAYRVLLPLPNTGAEFSLIPGLIGATIALIGLGLVVRTHRAMRVE